METWAIILAAGESSRMKANKLLLPFHGQPMISVVVAHAIEAGIENILVVTGATRDELLPVISKLPVKHCHNSDYPQGMLSSVQCGLKNTPESMNAAFIFLGDQPEVPASVPIMLAKAQVESGKGILVPVFSGKRGHPLMIHARFRNEVAALPQDKGLRGLLDRFPDEVLEVEVDTPGILKDIDSPEDYNELTKSK